jgi:hypothetical protein
MAKSSAERQREYRQRKREQRERELRDALRKPEGWHPDARVWGAIGNFVKKQRARHYAEHKIGDIQEGCIYCSQYERAQEIAREGSSGGEPAKAPTWSLP